MPVARLDDRAVIAVSGKDATPFLQGLVTNDIEKAAPALYAALLTPQGKILFDFIVQREGEGYLLDASAARADELLKRLKMYRLRAAVDLTPRPELAVFAAWGDDAPADRPHDPRLDGLGRRWIAQTAHAAGETGLAYHRHRLALGVPDSADIAGEFLLDANGEELHAVDFRKGCYVGQEVTARMKHKAKPRRRLLPVSPEGALPQPGTRLTTSDGADAGELASGAGALALASLRIDRVAPGDIIAAGDLKFRVRAPAYELPVATPR
jgi:folate-binding protein YgfZ